MTTKDEVIKPAAKKPKAKPAPKPAPAPQPKPEPKPISKGGDNGLFFDPFGIF